MLGFLRRHGWILMAVAGLLLEGCGSTTLRRAPVEDRSGNTSKPLVVVEAQAPALKPPPGIENAGKAGFYTVKPGDTLIHIGLDSGQNHKDIARWNNLDNPNRIEIGQVLRVVPPLSGEFAAVTKPVVSGAVAAAPIAAIGAAPAKVVPAPAASAPVAALSEDELPWIWPGNGPVVATFDEVKNKGIDLGGAAGDPVLAAADGRVVYAGARLRGYGNLIILKHNATYLTAYAHNQALMVKEDEPVKKGQKIAEMGNSDADRVKLHFEVRRQGKPVDPLKFLPAR
jgi:lipoprotein NlpD